MSIPESYHELFEKETYAHVTTLLPDGSPHAAPVWIDYDPERDLLAFNTVRGRRKERNLRGDPRVAVSIIDPDDPFRFLSVQGEAVDVTEEGAVEHVNELTQRYMGVEEYPRLEEDEGARVVVRVRPDHVVAR